MCVCVWGGGWGGDWGVWVCVRGVCGGGVCVCVCAQMDDSHSFSRLKLHVVLEIAHFFRNI